MKKARRKIDAALKAKIALEALREQSLRVPSRQVALLRRWLGLELRKHVGRGGTDTAAFAPLESTDVPKPPPLAAICPAIPVRLSGRASAPCRTVVLPALVPVAIPTCGTVPAVGRAHSRPFENMFRKISRPDIALMLHFGKRASHILRAGDALMVGRKLGTRLQCA